ncbi:MAG: GNAT family N-acetyltransferase [bacterium]|nr:GNAT family N-acetyltransferase [bacterium]
MTSSRPKQDIRTEIVGKEHESLPIFFTALPKDSGWPRGTILSLTDREPTEFEQADKYVIAILKNKTVGALSLHAAASGNYHRQHNLHFHIDVLPQYQNTGIGSALIARMIKYAAKMGFWRIYLGTLSWNQQALALFGSYGFRIEGVSRAAYRVKTDGGEEFFVDGIGMALWIGPQLKVNRNDWKSYIIDQTAPLPGEYVYSAEGSVVMEELVGLYESVGDQRFRFPELLMGAWRNSTNVITVRRNSELIGLIRCLTDDFSTLFICDILIRPEHQRRGVGSELMKRLQASINGIYQTILLTDPDTLPFYRKLDFMQWESSCLKMNRPTDRKLK